VAGPHAVSASPQPASYGRSDSQETTETTFYNMTDQHPITPPPELVQQWLEDAPEDGEFGISKHIATQAARWGSNQELEACVSYVDNNFSGNKARALRALRRPKPPSLKEQALKELKDWTNEKHGPGGEVFLCEGLSVDIIRRALESLPE
jgi:hypothetical protein